MRSLYARIRSLIGLSSSIGLERLLARLSGGAFVIEVIGAIVAFLVHWLLARRLGAGGVGIYLYCLSWVRLLALPAKLGLERASLRFVSSFEANREHGLLRGFMTRSHQMVLGASTLIGLLLFAVTRLLGERLESELLVAFGWAALALPLMSFGDLQVATLRGFKRITWALGSQKILRPVLMLALIGLALTVGGGLSADRAVALQVAAFAITLLLTTAGLWTAMPDELVTTKPDYQTREWLAVSMPLLLITGFNIVLKQTDIIMVGSLLTRADAGVYGAAARIAMLVQFGINAVNAGLAPLISQLHSQERAPELQRVVALGARLIFIFTALGGVAVMFGAGSILAIFGPEFEAGATALRVLMFSQLVNALAGPVGLLMTMTGNQKEAARVIGASALMNVVLNVVLIPLFGIVGAAIATTASMTAWNLTLVVLVRRRLGINSLVQWRVRPRGGNESD